MRDIEQALHESKSIRFEIERERLAFDGERLDKDDEQEVADRTERIA